MDTICGKLRAFPGIIPNYVDKGPHFLADFVSGVGNGSSDPRWCARIAADQSRLQKPIPDRADFDPDYDPSAPIECECCGSTMKYIAACKILCSNCGYKRDCSDP